MAGSAISPPSAKVCGRELPGPSGSGGRRRSNPPGNSQAPGTAYLGRSGERRRRGARRRGYPAASARKARAKLSGTETDGGQGRWPCRPLRTSVSERDVSTIAVIGSGITGVTTAYALLRRGHEVVVL